MTGFEKQLIGASWAVTFVMVSFMLETGRALSSWATLAETDRITNIAGFCFSFVLCGIAIWYRDGIYKDNARTAKAKPTTEGA